jgi:hypothetical protein
MSSFIRALIKAFGKVHNALYRGSGGKVLGRFRRVEYSGGAPTYSLVVKSCNGIRLGGSASRHVGG